MNPSISLRRIFASTALLTLSASTVATELQWETTSQRFEAEFDQTSVVATYAFTNQSDSPVTIVQASSSCGCTVPSLEKKVYKPNESGELKAVFSLGSRQGHQKKTISVTTNSNNGEHRYSLILEVEIPVALLLKPRVRFWKLGSEPKTQTVRITLHKRLPLKIEGVRRKDASSTDEAFQWEIETIEESKEYVLKITPKSSTNKARDVFYLTSEQDTKGILKKSPIYLYVR